MSKAIRAIMTEARWRGVWGTVRALKMNKFGTMNRFVDADKFGNRYFEDPTETYGRHRWVEYAETRNYDSLKIPPDWHAWLHHNIDVTPSKRPLKSPDYQGEIRGNLTGTSDAYVPSHHRLHKQYMGHANEKYESWNPTAAAAKSKSPDSKDVLDLK